MTVKLLISGVWACCLWGLLVGQTLCSESPAEIPFVDGQPLPMTKPGEGWTLVRKPATYKTVTETIEVSPAMSYMEIMPAKFEMREETVMVRPESKDLRIIPTAYKTETFQVLIEPEQTRYELIPAQYADGHEEVVVKAAHKELRTFPAEFKTVTERIEVAPAYTYWKKTNAGMSSETFCLCQVPAKYATITKDVLVREARNETVEIPAETKLVPVRKLVAKAMVKEIVIPAKYATMERQVLDTPATCAFDAVPAKFETIQKQVMVEPESRHKVDIPAKYETFSREVLAEPSHLVWRHVTCECGDIVKKYKEVPGTDEASLLRYKHK